MKRFSCIIITLVILLTSNSYSQFFKNRQNEVEVSISEDSSESVYRNVHRKIKKLNLSPQSENTTPYTGWEGHYGNVRSITFNNTGNWLISSGDDGTVRVWNSSSGNPEWLYLGHLSSVTSISISQNGNNLVSISDDNTIRFWNFYSTEIKNASMLDGSTRNIVKFMPDGLKAVSVGSDKLIKVWNCSTGAVVSSISSPSSVLSISPSLDGERIAAACNDNLIRIWDINSGVLIASISGHDGQVNSICYSNDGSKLVSSSVDKTIKIWDAASYSQLLSIPTLNLIPNSAIFTNDGSKVITSFDNNLIRVINCSDGSTYRTLIGHDKTITALCCSPTGDRFASSSNDGTIKIWELASANPVIIINAHTIDLGNFCLTRDEKNIVTCGIDWNIRIWDVQLKNLEKTLIGHTKNVSSLNYSPDELSIVSGSNDASLRMWGSTDGLLKNIFIGHTSEIYCNSFSKNGTKIISGSNDKTVKIWDSKTGSLLNTLSEHFGSVYSVDFSSDDTKIASGGYDKSIIVWNAYTGNIINKFQGHKAAIQTLKFHPVDEIIASGSWDETIKIWDVKNGLERFSVRAHPGGVSSVAFSSDGKRLVSAGFDNTIKIWNVENMSLLRTIYYSNGFAWNVSFNSTGNKIYAVGWGYKNIRIYDVGEQPLPAPALISPSSNAIDVTPNTMLSWEQVAGVKAYDIQVAKDDQFKNIVVNSTGWPSFNLQVNLETGTKYYWRVRSVNAEKISDWSNVWSFTTIQGIKEPNIVIPELYVRQNSVVEIPIKMQYLSSRNIYSYQFTLLYDTLMLKPDNQLITSGTLSSSNSWSAIANFSNRGKISVAGYGSAPISMDWDLLKIKFEIIGNTGAVTDLKFLDFTFNNGDPKAVTKDGKLYIISSVFCGDATNDETVNAYDASMILRYLVGIEQLSPLGMINADVDLDKSVSAFDAALIARRVIGLPLPLEVTKTCWDAVTLAKQKNIASYDLQVEKDFIQEESDRTIYSFNINTVGNELYSVSLKIKIDADEAIESFLINGCSNDVAYSINKVDKNIYKLALINPNSFDKEQMKLLITCKKENRIKFIVLSDINVNRDKLTDRSIQTEGSLALPVKHDLVGSFPNPFNPSTTVRYVLGGDLKVKIEIFNLLGKKVCTLINDNISAGSHEVIWNGKDDNFNTVSSGIYFCTMRAGDFVKTIKLNLLK